MLKYWQVGWPSWTSCLSKHAPDFQVHTLPLEGIEFSSQTQDRTCRHQAPQCPRQSFRKAKQRLFERAPQNLTISGLLDLCPFWLRLFNNVSTVIHTWRMSFTLSEIIRDPGEPGHCKLLLILRMVNPTLTHLRLTSVCWVWCSVMNSSTLHAMLQCWRPCSTGWPHGTCRSVSPLLKPFASSRSRHILRVPKTTCQQSRSNVTISSLLTSMIDGKILINPSLKSGQRSEILLSHSERGFYVLFVPKRGPIVWSRVSGACSPLWTVF